MGKCSIKMYLKHHEEQIEDILNYLEELSLHRIEKMEEGRISGYYSYYVSSYVDRMPPKRSSTSAIPAITQDAIRQLNAALEAQTAAMAISNNPNRNTEPREIPIAKTGNYKEFINLFSRSKCAEEDRVTFATVKKMEDEFYNLAVKGNDLKTYIRRFQELAALCSNMVPNTENLWKPSSEDYPKALKETLLLRNLKL
ncbi:hypothetical protein Tco_0968053 [Tanacetum coccineum]